MGQHPDRPIFLLVAGFAGSIVTFRGDLIRGLTAGGFHVHVAAPGLHDDEAVCRWLEGEGAVAHSIRLSRGGMDPLGDFLTLTDLVRLIRRIRPVAFLGYTIKPIVYGVLAARICRVPHRFALVTGLGQSLQPDASSWIRHLATWLYRTALPGAECVVFQNPDDERLFRKLRIVGQATRTVVVAGSGVDTDEYQLAPLPSVPAFLMIARLIAPKGVREFAEAARRVRAVRPEARFRLVGWMDHGRWAISPDELRAWQEAGTLEYLGQLVDVRPAIADASVFVLPSYYGEGTPRTILEAMSMGRAILTADTPGCRETVIDGFNGLLVPPRDTAALAAAMLRLIDEPELVSVMGNRCRTIAVDRYDVRHVTRAMLEAMHVPSMAG